MRLWYHQDSDALHISEEWDGVSEDVTESAEHRKAAKLRGMKFSYEVTSKPHTMADAIIESYKKWERRPHDYYATPVNAVEAIVDLLKGLGVQRVWEPACGDGRIARVLEWHGMDVTGTDFREHTGYGFGGLDFLNDDPVKKWGWEPQGFDAIVTNPPFSLAREFIEKSLTIAPIVCMLLKQTYWNTAGRFDFFNECKPTYFLPLTWRLAFLPERGKSPLMDCAWAVWINGNDDECRMQPVRRKVYPGYHGPGILSATAALTEACDELAKTFAGTRS